MWLKQRRLSDICSSNIISKLNQSIFVSKIRTSHTHKSTNQQWLSHHICSFSLLHVCSSSIAARMIKRKSENKLQHSISQPSRVKVVACAMAIERSAAPPNRGSPQTINGMLALFTKHATRYTHWNLPGHDVTNVRRSSQQFSENMLEHDPVFIVVECAVRALHLDWQHENLESASQATKSKIIEHMRLC